MEPVKKLPNFFHNFGPLFTQKPPKSSLKSRQNSKKIAGSGPDPIIRFWRKLALHKFFMHSYWQLLKKISPLEKGKKGDGSKSCSPTT